MVLQTIEVERSGTEDPLAGGVKSDVRDGMRIDWDLPITMDDGVVVRADL